MAGRSHNGADSADTCTVTCAKLFSHRKTNEIANTGAYLEANQVSNSISNTNADIWETNKKSNCTNTGTNVGAKRFSDKVTNCIPDISVFMFLSPALHGTRIPAVHQVLSYILWLFLEML